MGVVTAVAVVLMGWWSATAGAQVDVPPVPATPGMELQPLPGWTCQTSEPTPGYATPERCSTTVTAGDAELRCRQDSVSSYDSEDVTECAAALAGADVARCGLARTSEYYTNTITTAACASDAAFAGCAERIDHGNYGASQTTTGCGAAAGDAEASCAHVTREIVLWGETRDRAVGCGARAGDTAARCAAAREFLRHEFEDDVDAVAGGCATETAAGTTSCSARIDELQTAPVLKPACPATDARAAGG